MEHHSKHKEPCPAIELEVAMGLSERCPPGTEWDGQRRGERQDRGKGEAATSTQEQRGFQQRGHTRKWLLVTRLVCWGNGGTGHYVHCFYLSFAGASMGSA